MSSSIAIRKQITSASKRSLEMVDEYNKSFKNLKPDDTEPDEVSFHLEKAKLLRNQLSDTQKHIHDNVGKWERLIAQKTNPKDREKEDEIYNQFIEQAEYSYYEAAEQSTDAINGLDTLIIELSYMARPDNTGAAFHEPEAPRAMESSNFRLAAKLNHPTFDGNLETWPTFSETFKSAIHNNPSYTTIEKLSYLMSYLKGEAAESVVGYPIIASSYEIVWNVLEERFGDKDRLIHKMQAELRNLPPCRNSSQQELRRIYSTITRTTRCLASFEVDCDNDQTIAIIEEKVPKNILRELYITKEANGIKTWSVERLIKELNNIIKLNEKLDSVRPDPHVTANSSIPQKHNTVMIMHGKPKTPCILCGGQHWNSDCTSYPDTESRATRLRELQRCFICLQKGHTARSCERQVTCRICNRKHATLICRSADNGSQTQSTNYRQATSNHGFSNGHPKQFNKSQQNKQPQQTTNPKPQNQAPLTGGNAVAIRQTNFATQRSPTRKNGHLLSGIITLLKADGTTKDVAALIDTCSTVTLISDSLLKECGVEVQAQPEDKTNQAPLFAITTLGDQTNYYDDKWGTIEVSTVDQTSITLTAQIIPNLMKTVDIIVANDKGGTKTIETKAELLIGADHLYEIITEKPIKLDENGDSIYKWETLLGTAYGGGRTAKNITAILKKDEIKQEEEPKMPTNWSIEDSIKEESDDEIARKLFHKHLTRDPVTGRYTTKWLFKEDPSTLPSNFDTAFARLKGTIAGLKRSVMPNALQAYDAIIKAELASGTTELVTDETPQGQVIHILSHHAIYKWDSRTHQIRVVYDGSAPTWDGRCLNDLMHRGPINLPSIPGCLIRLRSAPIGMVGDVQKAFHQVGLSIPDRDFTRFLWLKDINKPVTKDNIDVYRFTSVTFGIVSSPSILGMTIDVHLKNHEHPLAEKLRRDIYVDNVTFHVKDVEDGKAQYLSSKKIFADAKMNLREYMSSNKELNKYLMEMEGHEIPKSTKILGVPWDLEDDEYSFPLPLTPNQEKPPTMRKVLEHISKAYDVCGLNAPALLKPKLFFQNLMYKSGGKAKWDELLQHEDAQQWQEILTEWTGASNHIRYSPALEDPKSRFHIFTDASENAICAVAYVIGQDNKSTILMAQQRLSSRKTKRTIPDLETAAIAEGTKLIQFLRREVPELTDKIAVLHSDSQIALAYVNKGKADSVFANNRIKKIREVPSVTFQYVPTNCNPADIGTRGCTMEELKKSKLWNQGPLSAMQLPLNQPYYISTDKPTVINPVVCMVTEAVDVESQNETSSIINVSRFSSWAKARRVAVQVLKFINILKKKVESGTTLRNRATTLLIAESQARNTPSEAQIKGNNMFLDKNGLWRCKSRFPYQTLIESDPIYLPKKDYCTTLVVQAEHEKQQHAGMQQTLANLQKTFWIPQGRKTTKRILKSCMVCRRLHALPFTLPPMGNLPNKRVMFSAPFTHTGVDYLGPFTLRKFHSSTETYKAWIALFTCLSTRAIHLEIVQDLTANAFLQALRRFVSRRGCPATMLSDNASTFKLADATICEAIKRKMLDYDITWRNIPALSPWKGGVYERLVGLVKKSMKAAIGKRIVDTYCMYTSICEIEAALNKRPLTYVPGDEPGIAVLSPSDFLTPLQKSSMFLNTANEDDNDEEWRITEMPSDKLLAHWRQTHIIVERFMTRFSNEYLPYLRERSMQTKHKGAHLESHVEPKVGQVVLLRDTDGFGADPTKWPLAMITELSNNNSTATIRIGEGRQLQRPINMLHPLELEASWAGRRQEDSAAETAVEAPAAEEPPVASRLRSSTKISNVLAIIMMFIMMFTSCLANATTPTACTTCAECTLGGVKLNYKTELDSVRLCVYNRCFSFTEVTKDEVLLLPITVTSAQYNTRIVAWHQNEKAVDTFLACEPGVICELLKCRLCWDFIKNPQCDTLAATVMAIAAIVMLSIFSKVIFCATTISSCITWFSRKLQRTPPRLRHTFARRRTLLITLMFVLIRLSSACSQSNTFTTSTERCTHAENGIINCKVVSNAIVSSKIGDRTICLLIKDNNNNTLSTVKVSITKVELSCQQTTLFYTRDHLLKTVSRKRCPGVGSCKGEKCAGVHGDSEIEELSEGNEHPGYTHCSASCGCAACGCLRCDDGCLFHRIFAVPTSKIIYKVVQCTSFKPWISFQAAITGTSSNNGIQTRESAPFKTTTGNAMSWDDVTYTILSATIPPLPILSSKFIIDIRQRKARIIETSGVGQNVAGTVGQLQCSSQSAAYKFNCNFPSDACKCDLQQEAVSCLCPKLNLSEIMTHNDYALPLVTEGVTIFFDDNNNIKASLADTTDIQMQINFDQFTIATVQTNSTCEMHNCKITGCIDCNTSPFIQTSCSTNYGDAILELHCGDISTSITCTTKATLQTKNIAVNLNQRNNKEACKFRCPGGEGTVQCEFNLFKTEAEDVIKVDQGGAILGEVKEENFADLIEAEFNKLNIFAELWTNTKTVFIIVGFVAISYILIRCLYPYVYPLIIDTLVPGGGVLHHVPHLQRMRNNYKHL